MSETHEIRLKRLTMRANHRGTKEMDIILGRWAAERLATADSKTLDIFEDLLEENDQDLYQWVTAQVETPSKFKGFVAELQEVVGTRNNSA